jgi:hypothetical protein
MSEALTARGKHKLLRLQRWQEDSRAGGCVLVMICPMVSTCVIPFNCLGYTLILLMFIAKSIREYPSVTGSGGAVVGWNKAGKNRGKTREEEPCRYTTGLDVAVISPIY